MGRTAGLCPARVAGNENAPVMPSPDPKQSRWFAEEIHPHEAILRGYLRGAFPAVQDIDDVVQESYLRVWKAASVRQIASAKAFLFRVARNVALDLVRRHRSCPVQPVGNLALLPVIEEKSAEAEAPSLEARITLLVEAVEALPPRSREVMILCKFQSLSYREAAAQLGISEKTVGEHLYRGMKRLGEELQRRGVTQFPE